MTHGGYRGEPTAPSRADPFGVIRLIPSPAVATGAPETPAPQQQETHTLATLSVVFAFVFAPAGVILGHLALSQIHQTGQRGRDRALVGVTLSYVFITVAVVALIVSAAGVPVR